MIYKILSRKEWSAAQQAGVFTGSAVDLRDGYIHFSTAEQAAETAAKHFAGQGDLVLLGVDEKQFGDELKWEVSRGGASFPHLYGDLNTSAVSSIDELPLDADGRHVFPNQIKS